MSLFKIKSRFLYYKNNFSVLRARRDGCTAASLDLNSGNTLMPWIKFPINSLNSSI